MTNCSLPCRHGEAAGCWLTSRTATSFTRYLTKMLVFDTNILVYAIHEDSELHLPCFNFLEKSRRGTEPAFLTWSICYEFLRVTTHPNFLGSPMSLREAWQYLEDLIDGCGFRVLAPTQRHVAVLSDVLEELPDIRGNIAHDLHIAVLMREHGVSRICTHDADFHRFPFLTVIDPIRAEP